MRAISRVEIRINEFRKNYENNDASDRFEIIGILKNKDGSEEEICIAPNSLARDIIIKDRASPKETSMVNIDLILSRFRKEN